MLPRSDHVHLSKVSLHPLVYKHLNPCLTCPIWQHPRGNYATIGRVGLERLSFLQDDGVLVYQK